MISDRKLESKEILEIYRTRDCIEKEGEENFVGDSQDNCSWRSLK